MSIEREGNLEFVQDLISYRSHQVIQSGKQVFLTAVGVAREMHETQVYFGREALLPRSECVNISKGIREAKQMTSRQSDG